MNLANPSTNAATQESILKELKEIQSVRED